MDAVDAIVEQWKRERPDLDPSAKHVTGRVVRLASLFEQAFADAFEAAGLSPGDYGVLVALRRAGAPFRLTPTELARQRMMTSGGMTPVLDRLERQGLVTRLPNSEDRRGSLVELTKKGRRAVDGAMERHTGAEQRLVGGWMHANASSSPRCCASSYCRSTASMGRSRRVPLRPPTLMGSMPGALAARATAPSTVSRMRWPAGSGCRSARAHAVARARPGVAGRGRS